MLESTQNDDHHGCDHSVKHQGDHRVFPCQVHLLASDKVASERTCGVRDAQWYHENKQDDLKGASIELYLNSVTLKDSIAIANLPIFGGYMHIHSSKPETDTDLFELKIRRKLIEKKEGTEENETEEEEEEDQE